jgi:YD repeat-containing protein
VGITFLQDLPKGSTPSPFNEDKNDRESRSLTERQNMTSTTRVFVSTILLLAALAIKTQSQNPAPGTPVNSPQISVPLGSINALTGNVHLEIPIASIPQRDDDPMIAKFVYDTTYSHYVIGIGWTGGAGWRVVFGPARAGTIASTTVNGPCPDSAYPNGSTYTTSNFGFQDASGTQHNFPSQLYVYHIVCTDNSGNPDPNTGSPSSLTTSDNDGLGYNLFVNNWTNWDVSDIDNNLVASFDTSNFPEDPNGNYFSAVGPLADMLHRQTISMPNNIYPQCSRTHMGPDTIHVTRSDGSVDTYTTYCQTYNVSETGYPSSTVTLFSKIVLPDGTTYLFDYDSGTSGNHFGALTSITLATGGQESLTYSCTTSTTGSPCDLSSVTYGGGTWSFSWKRDQYGNYIGPTTITSPPRYDAISKQNVNDKTIYNYSFPAGDLQHPVIGSIQSYSGATTLLKTDSWTYITTAPSLVDTVTSTLNDTNQNTKVQYQYLTNLRNRPTQIQEWDYGTTTPVRTTKYSYGTGNLVTSVSVWAGDGTTGSPLTQTNYTYDEYSANYCKNGVPMLTNTPGAVGHDDANYGINDTSFRGNVTTISRWVSGSTWRVSHKCYDTLGNVTQEVDEAGNPTTYDYAEKWADSSCIPAGIVTRAYPTTITDAAGFQTTTTYYTCTALQQATTDENTNITTYTYSDPFWRVVSMTDPTNVSTNYYYNFFLAGNGNAFIDKYVIINGGSAETDTVTYLDTFGKVEEVQHRQAPLTDTYDTTTYTYDNAGRQNSVSIPCVASGDEGATCSSPTTVQNFDALSRPTLKTDGGGGTETNTYKGRDVLSVVSSPNTSRQLEYDYLGRLISVCEMSTSLPGVGTCKQDNAQTGYWTRYQYDVAGNLTGVCQNTTQAYSVDCVANPSSGQQTRRFTYDGLGRMTSESHPESGLKQYFYDSAPTSPGVACPGPYNGDLVKTYDANGNTTCFAYDSLHRAVSTSFSGPNSSGINRYFVYDAANVNGIVMQNTKSRLAEAYTAASKTGTKIQLFCSGRTHRCTRIYCSFRRILPHHCDLL